MAIDDPIQAFEQQYMQDERPPALELIKFVDNLGFPGSGIAAEILPRVVRVLFDPVSTEERFRGMFDLFKGELSRIERTKTSIEDVQEAIQRAFTYDRYERNDKKRERYVKLIGGALRSEVRIENVASFIQTIEQLNEQDVVVLKVLNQIMNKEGDWRPQPNPGDHPVMKLHPSTLINRAQELSVQVALALRQKTETNAYTREEGYGICNRLQGFGLAHELQQTRELPLANYCFRLSVQGIRLLQLLGENVPNFEYYFQEG